MAHSGYELMSGGEMSAASRARVLIADDHLPTRERLRLTLANAGFEVIACVRDAIAAARIAAAQRPDLCVLDVHMDGGGITAAKEITARAPGTVVVMLTVSRNDADLFDALQSGASGYILKDQDLRDVPDLLWRALEGEALLSGALTARLVEEFRERGRRTRVLAKTHPGTELTRREWQVLELLGQHLTTKEVAERLFVEPVTVRTHVAAILRKLSAPSREVALRLLASERDHRPLG
jgi:DNA-binding NarL/FixJ family response regulator